MNINYTLPYEMLLKIFKNLDGRTLMNSRKVCQRWRAVIDTIHESFWKKRCTREFPDIGESAYSRSLLTWKDLYGSLLKWPDLDDCAVAVRELRTVTPIRDYYLLNDNTVVCSHMRNTECDLIIYYSLDTMREIRRQEMEMHMVKYYEDDGMIVFEFHTGEMTVLRAITKLDGGAFLDEHICAGSNWFVRDNSLFYIKYHRMRHVCHLKRLMFYNRVVDTTILAEWEGAIDDVAVRSAGINVLQYHSMTHDMSADNRMSIIHVHAEVRRTLQFCQRLDVNEVRAYGFLWTTPEWLPKLRAMHPEDDRFTKHDVYSALSYGQNVLTTTSVAPAQIKIFHKPYAENGQLLLQYARPDAIIDISPFLKYRQRLRNKNLKNLNVVETRRGHDITALCGGTLLVIELQHPKEVTRYSRLTGAVGVENYLLSNNGKQFEIRTPKTSTASVQETIAEAQNRPTNTPAPSPSEVQYLSDQEASTSGSQSCRSEMKEIALKSPDTQEPLQLPAAEDKPSTTEDNTTAVSATPVSCSPSTSGHQTLPTPATSLTFRTKPSTNLLACLLAKTPKTFSPSESTIYSRTSFVPPSIQSLSTRTASVVPPQDFLSREAARRVSCLSLNLMLRSLSTIPIYTSSSVREPSLSASRMDLSSRGNSQATESYGARNRFPRRSLRESSRRAPYVRASPRILEWGSEDRENPNTGRRESDEKDRSVKSDDETDDDDKSKPP